VIEGEDPGDAVDPAMQAQPASVLLEGVTPPDEEPAPPVDTTSEEGSGSDTTDVTDASQPPEMNPDPDPGEG